MVPRSHLQLLSVGSGLPGTGGFKLIGHAKEGTGMCRVWLRRKDPWDRYLDPRFRSDVWDVRCHTKTDSAFAIVAEFSADSLEDLAERFDFTAAAGKLNKLSTNGDIVHDTVLVWAKKVAGSAANVVDMPEDTPAPANETSAEDSAEDPEAEEAARAAEVEAVTKAAEEEAAKKAAEEAAAAKAAQEAAAAKAAEQAALKAEQEAAAAKAAQEAAEEAAAAKAAEKAAEEAAAAKAAADAEAAKADAEAAQTPAVEDALAETAPVQATKPSTTKTVSLTPVRASFEETSDAWDEIAEMAGAATSEDEDA